MLKLFLVLGIVLGVTQCVADKANAATSDPHTTCNQKITWAVSDTYAPRFAGDTIRWAYTQVAVPTGTVAVNNAEQDINWDWQSALSGSNYSPNTTYLDTSIFGGREFWTHAFDGDVLDPNPATVKQQVLRLVVEDFGVTGATSTATGLSEKDRAALKALCKAKPAATPTKDPKGDAKDNKVDKADKADKDTDTADEPATGTPTPGGSAGLWLILLLLAPALAYGLFGPNVLKVVNRRKGRNEHHGDDETS